MARKSIFDCDSIFKEKESTREKIVYDDDWFTFGSELPSDKKDAVPKNLSISVTVSKIDKSRPKNGKRNASHDMKLDDKSILKVKKTNMPTIKVISNGQDRQAVSSDKQSKEYKILKEIGRGTYGSVYKAKLENNDTIAVKRLICKLDQPHTVKSN